MTYSFVLFCVLLCSLFSREKIIPSNPIFMRTSLSQSLSSNWSRLEFQSITKMDIRMNESSQQTAQDILRQLGTSKQKLGNYSLHSISLNLRLEKGQKLCITKSHSQMLLPNLHRSLVLTKLRDNRLIWLGERSLVIDIVLVASSQKLWGCSKTILCEDLMNKMVVKALLVEVDVVFIVILLKEFDDRLSALVGDTRKRGHSGRFWIKVESRGVLVVGDLRCHLASLVMPCDC